MEWDWQGQVLKTVNWAFVTLGCWENILSPSDNHGINQTDVLKKKKICKNINPYIFAQLVFTAKHSTANLSYSKYVRYEIYICCNHHPSSPTLQTKWRVCQFNKFISKLWKYLINLTCWQAGCDSMLRVGRGQGWLPNATLSGKLRGREGRRRRWGIGDTIQIFPPSKVRGVGEESRKGGGGVKAENLLQFRDIFDLSSPEPTVTIT